jgi:acetyl esterase/lipase
MSVDDFPLQVPAQSIPAPHSISPQGRAYLAAASQKLSQRSAAKPIGDASHELREKEAEAIGFLGPLASRFQGSFESTELATGAKLYRVTPEGRSGRLAEVAYFDIHGGGFLVGGDEMCRLLAQIRAREFGAEVYSVDYRLLPLHPFPAALDDCLLAYREIVGRRGATTLVVGGSSAGGTLAAALLLRARDEGLPLPLALVLQTPGLDMSRSGDSFTTNRYLDVNLYDAVGEDALRRYAAGTDLEHPYVSSLFGDFTQGWPPTILTTGTRDLLLSDTVRMHRALRRAGIRAELHVSEAGPHGGFMGAGAPEDAEISAECRRFIYAAWGAALPPSPVSHSG